jgi:hypothetical protein
MDLRFRPKARTTKDVDLSVSLVAIDPTAPLISLRDRLQEAAGTDLGATLPSGSESQRKN